MKKKFVFVLFSVLAIAAMVLTSCASTSTTTPGTTGSNGTPTSTSQSGTGSPTNGTQPTTSTTSQPGSTSGTGTSSGETGQVQVLVTDAPATDNITSILITVSKVEISEEGASDNQTVTSGATNTPATQEQEQTQEQSQEHGKGNGRSSNPNATVTDNETSNPTETPSQPEPSGTGHWITMSLTDNNTFDLLTLSGRTGILAVGDSLPVGTYTQIRMDVTSVEVTINGETKDATIPSGELKFVHPFEVVAGKTTTLLFDFDAAKSIVVAGNQVIFKPVIKLSVNDNPGNANTASSALPHFVPTPSETN